MKRTPVIHPFLLAIYPVLCSFRASLNGLQPRDIVVPTIVATCLVLILWLLLSLLIGNRQKAGLLVSAATVLISSFGHVAMLIYLATAPHNFSGILIAIWCAVFALCAYGSLRADRRLQVLTKIMNATTAFMVAMPGVLIGIHYLKSVSILPVAMSTENVELNLEDMEKQSNLPNIYYIILDGYARGDILDESFQHDNSEFLEYLTGKGFYVASKSRSNYATTHLSLASSLNLDYLDGLARQVGAEYGSRLPLTKMIKDSKVVHLLNQCGYTIVALSSGASFTEMTNADIYIRTGHIGMFANELISNILFTSPTRGLKIQYDIHRKSMLRTFEKLEKTCELKAPIFVFAHIFAAHPPFVFGEGGEAIQPNKMFMFEDENMFTRLSEADGKDEYRRNYINQLAYISKRTRVMIDHILSNSARPPVIILQADHGPGFMLDWEGPYKSYIRERMAILNAYYLPDDGHELLYDKITPVNTFRITFNHYLGTDFELLEDRCYFSTWNHPYKFIDVTSETSEHGTADILVSPAR